MQRLGKTGLVLWVLVGAFVASPALAAPGGPPPNDVDPCECFHSGDVNGDGVVSAGDAQLAFFIALGSVQPTPEQNCAADANGDGTVSSGDAQLIFLGALGAGPVPTQQPNGQCCTEAVQCASGYCANGFCCTTGDCCAEAADCPASYSEPPTCDDPPTCGGYRADPLCTAFSCDINFVEDDSACGPEVWADPCDLYADLYCTGAPEQSVQCPSSCATDAECDAEAHCEGTCVDDLADGSPCDDPGDCLSGYCSNGFCCTTGDCCATANDCPAAYGGPAFCADPATCQGYRSDAVCVSAVCDSTSVEDDSGCGADVISSECDSFPAEYCSGAAEQSTPECATTCAGPEDCDPGSSCVLTTCHPPGETYITEPTYVDEGRSPLATAVAAGSESIEVADGSGFAVGGEVVLLAVLGPGAGNYELADVAEVNGNTLVFTAPLRNAYPAAPTGASFVQPVFHASVLLVGWGGVAMAHPWDGESGGLVVIRTDEGIWVQEEGVIHADGVGYRGGAGGTAAGGGGQNGETYTGIQGSGGYACTSAGTYGGGAGDGVAQVSAGGSGAGGGGGDSTENDDDGAGGGGGGGHAGGGGGGGGATGCTAPEYSSGKGGAGGADGQSAGGGGSSGCPGGHGGAAGNAGQNQCGGAGAAGSGATGGGGGSGCTGCNYGGGGGGGGGRFGEATLAVMHYGGGGGGGGGSAFGFAGAAGGAGGGIVYLIAPEILIDGRVSADGAAGGEAGQIWREGCGGSGAGGAVRVEAGWVVSEGIVRAAGAAPTCTATDQRAGGGGGGAGYVADGSPPSRNAPAVSSPGR